MSITSVTTSILSSKNNKLSFTININITYIKQNKIGPSRQPCGTLVCTTEYSEFSIGNSIKTTGGWRRFFIGFSLEVVAKIFAYTSVFP